MAQKSKIYKRLYKDFSGGPEVKNLPTNAGDTGLIPSPRPKIPHAMEQLSPHALEPMLRNKRSHLSEKLTHRN